jgi:hypothetical protein
MSAKKKMTYRLDQASPQGKPGFEPFHEPVANKYFFHFNDDAGLPILFSPVCGSARQRDQLLALTQENATRTDRYQSCQKGENFYFVLYAAERREIGRSPYFASEADMNQAMLVLQRTFASDDPVAEELAPPSVEKSASARHRFILTFRRLEESRRLTGTIEYPLERAQRHFEGLNWGLVQQFVRDFLNREQGEAAPAIQNEARIDSSNALVGSARAGFELDARMRFLEEGKPVEGHILNLSKNVEVQIKGPESMTGGRLPYRAEIFLEALPSGARNHAGRREGMLSEGATIHLPLKPDNWRPGVYRMTIELDLGAFRYHNARLMRLNG